MSLQTPADLRCYECAHEYVHLGDGDHPGRCPRCRSRAVSPAGRLEVATVVESHSADGSSPLTVLATDETYRSFLVELESAGGRLAVDLVQIEEVAFSGESLPTASRLRRSLEAAVEGHFDRDGPAGFRRAGRRGRLP